VWNLVFAFIAGYYLLRKDFLNQFKHFNFKSFAWGLPLVLFSGMLFSFLYSLIFGQPTPNAINDTLSVKMILFQVPFIAGYYLLRKDFLNQFKHFNFKSFAWGLPLVLFSGMLFSFLYSLIFGQPTPNAINDTCLLYTSRCV
ncbi:hypothetical protein A5885_003642, partial [Enterococcus sp. 8E11_MSG4843]